MTARERLEQYLEQIRQRLRTAIVARASAVVAITALVVTVGAVWMLRDPGFPASAVLTARIVLVLSLLVAAGAMLWQPLLALQPRNRSKAFERHLPTQGGRIETYLEQVRRREAGEPVPLIDLLAEDAMAVAETAPPETAVPRQRMLIPAAIAAAAVVALVALMIFGGAGFGFGSRHLWFGTTIPKEVIAARSILVKPGDTTIRRNQDVPIQATMQGFTAQNAEVYVRFGDSKDYERAPMKAAANGEFEFTLYALREPLSYYVVSQGAKSAEHHIFVADVPRIEKMRLTYNYPSWTGLQKEVDENIRDIAAVAGTKIDVEVQTTAPLDSPTLKVNDKASDLNRDGNWSRGTIELTKAGTYRIHAKVGDELVPLTDEYQLSIIEDQKPTIEIAKPGRDWQASSIEEVPVRIHAKDDFRVQNVELHYSVNGGDWKVKPLTAQGATQGKDVNQSALMRLEEMGELQANVASDAHLTPGDIVTYYAVAKDRKQEVQTDLFLIHVQPFERRFTQGQAGGGGGGGGGGDEQNAISQRQREILLATWNLQRTKDNAKGREAERVDDNAKMLAELQGTLSEQAQTLIDRAKARGVDNADAKNKALIDNLQQAVTAMAPAAKSLNDIELQKAIPSEQKALQHLLRAEALYTDIEMQFRSAQGGGGVGNQAGRDLAEMFELEMDLEKNQYETESRKSKEDSPEQLADAIQKLKDLARRQEQLARQQQNQQGQRESDKWQQEQLKRETEQLRKQLEQLAQQNANSRGSGGKGQGQGQDPRNSDPSGQMEGVQQGNGGESSSQQSARMAANDALKQIQQALENMQRAAGEQNQQGQPGQRGQQQQGQQQGGLQARNGQQANGQANGQQGNGQQANGQQANGQQPNDPQAAQRAADASRALRAALDKMEQGRRDGMAGSFDDLARRAQQMVENQREQQQEMLNAYASRDGAQGSQQGGANGNSQNRRGGLSWEQAERMAEQKRSLAQELENLQREMQAAARSHKEDAPQAASNVGTAAQNVADSGLNSALQRSAMEIERGRGLQAAAREPLITEAMEALENDLAKAAQIASNEAQKRKNGKQEASPEELLAELSDLRRAWQQAQAEQQRLAGGQGLNPNDVNRQRLARNGQFDPNGLNGLDPNNRNGLGGRNPNDPNGRGQNGNDPNARGQNGLDPNDPNGRGQNGNDPNQRSQNSQGQGQQNAQGSQGQNGQQPGNGQQSGQQSGGNQSGQGGQQSGQGQQGGQQGGANANGGGYANNGSFTNGGNLGGGGWNGGPYGWRGGYWDPNRGRLNGWNPPLPANALPPVDPDEYRRQAEAFARRLRELGDRLPQGALSDVDINALRQLSNRLRNSSHGDPMENEYARMVGLVDQLELAALNASEKNKATATRASRPTEDAPEYRETVAEYYRRLGNDSK